MNRTIYTFWEPKDSITPYIELCMEKWKPFMRGYELVILDYSNLFDYIPKESLDLNKISSVYLGLQKDVIQAMVLKHNGGIFIDADMILLRHLDHLSHLLDRYEVITFSSHLAFMMARPGARLINEWYEEVRRKIDTLEENAPVRWDYFGNSILNKKLRNKSYHAYKIDKFKTAFTPELNYYRNAGDVIANYVNFWFSSEIPVSQVFYRDQIMVALHHTWTPVWYQQLDRQGVLNHDCLLSRLLNATIESINSAQCNTLSWKDHLLIKTNSKIKGLRRRLFAD